MKAAARHLTPGLLYVALGIFLWRSFFDWPLSWPTVIGLVALFGIATTHWVYPDINRFLLNPKLPPEVQAVLHSVNKAHENAAALDAKLDALQNDVTKLSLRIGIRGAEDE